MTVTVPVVAGLGVVVAFVGIVALVMVIKWLIGIVF